MFAYEFVTDTILTAMAWHIAYEKVRPYVVRIETMEGFGTGFLFAYNKTHTIAAIATASHVIASAVDWKQPLKIWHPESNKIAYSEDDDRASWLDRKHDAATILVPSRLFKFPADVLPLVPEGRVRRLELK